jgi:hypothetical protein
MIGNSSAGSSPHFAYGSEIGSQGFFLATSGGSPNMLLGIPNQWRSYGDDNPFAGGAGIREKGKPFGLGEMEMDQTIRGSRGRQLSWISSRTPGLNWPGHSLPGKIKSGMKIQSLYI